VGTLMKNFYEKLVIYIYIYMTLRHTTFYLIPKLRSKLKDGQKSSDFLLQESKSKIAGTRVLYRPWGVIEGQ
jgi:hypothetical protein